MARYTPTRSQITLDLGLQGFGSLTFMERAFFVHMAHDQPTATKECSVLADVEIRAFSLTPDNTYQQDISEFVPARTVRIVGNNDTLLDAMTFEELAHRDVANGETVQQFLDRTDVEFPQPTILQGDGFNIERDQLNGDTHELLVHHIRKAADIGRLKRPQ